MGYKGLTTLYFLNTTSTERSQHLSYNFKSTFATFCQSLSSPIKSFKMLSKNVLLTLLASTSIVVALPGNSGYATPPKETPKSSAVGYPTPPKETPKSSAGYGYPTPSQETICTPGKLCEMVYDGLTSNRGVVYVTKTNVGEQTTTYLTTKTVVVPVTTVNEKPSTVTNAYPYSSTGYVTQVSLSAELDYT